MTLFIMFVLGIFSFLFIYISGSIIQDESIVVNVYNEDKLLFISPYILTFMLFFIFSYYMLKTEKTYLASFLYLSFSSLLTYFHLFYHGFISDKGNMEHVIYNNGIFCVTKTRSLEEKMAFLDKIETILDVSQEKLKKAKEIDLTNCLSYQEILNKVKENLILQEKTETQANSFFAEIWKNTHQFMVDHPFLTTAVMFTTVFIGCMYLLTQFGDDNWHKTFNLINQEGEDIKRLLIRNIKELVIHKYNDVDLSLLPFAEKTKTIYEICKDLDITMHLFPQVESHELKIQLKEIIKLLIECLATEPEMQSNWLQELITAEGTFITMDSFSAVVDAWFSISN